MWSSFYSYLILNEQIFALWNTQVTFNKSSQTEQVILCPEDCPENKARNAVLQIFTEQSTNICILMHPLK